jgi:hypothetical protein
MKLVNDPNWTVDAALLDYIYQILPVGKTVLELGSGYSTRRFCDHGYKVFTVESDPTWVNVVKEATYIHAPIQPWGRSNRPLKSVLKRCPEHTGWYDPKTLRKLLPKEYDLILVDGPCRDYGRSGFFCHFDLFRHDVPIIFDDLHRPDDYYIARRCAEALELDLTIKNNGPNKKPFGVILP